MLRLHYADTLREWSERFRKCRRQAEQMLGERFCRMWECYLAGCEMSFRRLQQMVFQLQLARRRSTVPLTRDYLLATERACPLERALATE